MNLKQINSIRASANLPALAVNTEKKAAQIKRQRDNHAARAEANREMKSLRGSSRKAKG